MDVFLQTVCYSLAVGIVTKISFSKTNGVPWLKMEVCSCLLLFREIRYVKMGILFPPMVQGPRLSLIADHNFSLIRERGASENLEAVKETMRKKNHVKKNVNPNKGSTKTFICFSS